MLVVSVKEGEYLMIGDDIRILFIEEMSSNCMRIGINAPKTVPVVRGKPYEKRLLENAEKNLKRLEEIELKKQDHIIAKQKTKEKRRIAAIEKREKKA